MVILSAFLIPFFHGICNMLEGHLSKYSIKSLYSIVFFTRTAHLAGVLFLMLAFGLPEVPDMRSFMAISAAAAISTFLIFPFLAAYRYIDTSTAGAFLSLGKVFTPVFAYLIIGESLAHSQYAGFGIIIISSILLGLDGKQRFRINPGFFLMMLTAMMAAMETITLKMAGGIGWYAATFWFVALSAIIPFLLLIPKKTRRDIMETLPSFRLHVPFFLLIVLFGMLGTFARLYALSGLPVVAVSAINAVRPLMVLGMGFAAAKIMGVRINEKLSGTPMLKKVACFAFIILGIWITIGVF